MINYIKNQIYKIIKNKALTVRLAGIFSVTLLIISSTVLIVSFKSPSKKSSVQQQILTTWLANETIIDLSNPTKDFKSNRDKDYLDIDYKSSSSSSKSSESLISTQNQSQEISKPTANLNKSLTLEKINLMIEEADKIIPQTKLSNRILN